jgi:alpha-beta hydrolase superfamily lysophospholipase
MADHGTEHRVEYLRAAADVEIPVRVFGPQGEGVPVIMLHGLRSHSGWFVRSAGFLASLGHPVYSFDRRGSGLSRQMRGHVNRWRDLIDEVDAVAACAAQRHGRSQVHVLGHCFGAIPGAGFACRHPDRVASLILPTPGLHTRVPLTRGRRVQITLWRFTRPGHRLGFPLGAEDLADLEPDRQFIRNDPLSLHELTAGFCFAVFCARRFLKRSLPRLKAPLFMALAGRDRISDNERNRASFDQAPSANKKLTVYPDATHILEFSREKEAFFRDLGNWLAREYNPSTTCKA